MCGYVKPCDQQPRLSMSNPMRSKISGHIEMALLGKSSDVGISALGIDSGRTTGNPEVISSPVGLVPRNALALTEPPHFARSRFRRLLGRTWERTQSHRPNAHSGRNNP